MATKAKKSTSASVSSKKKKAVTKPALRVKVVKQPVVDETSTEVDTYLKDVKRAQQVRGIKVLLAAIFFVAVSAFGFVYVVNGVNNINEVLYNALTK